MAIGGLKGWSAASLDVRTAFLTAPLQWCIREKESRDLCGTLGVYVDDLLLMAPQCELEPLIEAIQAIWRCSAPEYATAPGGFTFCGLQIEQIGEDL